MRSQRSKGRIAWVIVLACAIGWVAATTMPRGASAADVTDANVAEAIAAAKTPQDHEAIAAYFRSQAAAQGEKAKLHEAMLKSWEKSVAGNSLKQMRGHCQSLIDSSHKMEKDYAAMAEMHADMAKSAK